MSASAAELDDVQALVKTGFGTLGSARYLLFDIGDAAAARRWLARNPPTTIADISGSKAEQAVQVALSAPGLAALGLADETLAGFPAEFLLGMGSEPIARRLGDVGAASSRHWSWGAPGQLPHLLVLLYAHPERIEALAAELVTTMRNHGLSLKAAHASEAPVDREPFGFLDGVSQPEIDWSGRRCPPRGSANHVYRNDLALGEVLLGHRNEYGLITDSPILERATDGPFDLGRNGSFLVFRRLEQDVKGFWQWLRATGGSDEAAIALAERIVGRRMDGTPAVGLPGDAFTFAGDPEGIICPVGAHIRRANPRTGDLAGGRAGLIGASLAMLGLGGSPEADAIASARFHRLLRRGRSYGAPSDPREALDPAPPARAAGLNFICLNANIARQFEFVQGAWLASSGFAALSGQGDPLTGTREAFPGGVRTDRFVTREANAVRVYRNMPRFVDVTAGGYFFLPSATALQVLAND